VRDGAAFAEDLRARDEASQALSRRLLVGKRILETRGY